MQCPKHRTMQLTATRLAVGALEASQCPTCRGNWITSEHYEAWCAQQPQPGQPLQSLSISIADAADAEISPTDSKAGLCPECGTYLTRSRVGMKRPFYLERCPCCNGVWLDAGEWEILEKMGLVTQIPQIFSSQWQAQMRSLQQHESERQAIVEKLGEELSGKFFALAELLEKHPHGDYAVAYLMRRFEREPEEKVSRAG